MAITQNTATKKPMSIAIQSNVAKKLRITITHLLQPVNCHIAYYLSTLLRYLWLPDRASPQ